MAATLANLPPEILCQVFESAHDFSMVGALGQTAHIFRDTWREHPASICKAVASRVFPNLVDAELLIDIQEKAEVLRQPNQSQQYGCDDRAILWAKRLLFNARCASAFYDGWVTVCRIQYYSHREGNLMTLSERARLEHAFYCFWSICIMGNTAHLQEKALEYLDKCSPRELYRLNEMSQWIRYYNENDLGDLGLNFQDQMWKTGEDLVMKHWKADPDRWEPFTEYHDRTPFGFLAFFDHTQRYLLRLPDCS